VLSSIDDVGRMAVQAGETQAMSVPAGTVLFEEGQPCRGFPMVLSGCLRVARGSPDGRHLELYRVIQGQVCAVSTSCLSGQVPLSAHGVAEEATDLVLLTRGGFARWSTQEGFRRYLFGIFADRLAHRLLGHGQVVRRTHQALADELGQRS